LKVEMSIGVRTDERMRAAARAAARERVEPLVLELEHWEGLRCRVTLQAWQDVRMPGEPEPEWKEAEIGLELADAMLLRALRVVGEELARRWLAARETAGEGVGGGAR
jgi:hypothetical protein